MLRRRQSFLSTLISQDHLQFLLPVVELLGEFLLLTLGKQIDGLLLRHWLRLLPRESLALFLQLGQLHVEHVLVRALLRLRDFLKLSLAWVWLLLEWFTCAR